jgi:HSP20 family molecular chaperone IbpA
MANIVRYRPLDLRPTSRQSYPAFWEPMDRLHRQMNELFESSFSRLWDDDGSLAGVRFDPSLDNEQDEDRYEISLELPGVSLEDVSVDVQGDESRGEKLVQGAPRKAESKGEKFAKGASQEADSADAAQQDKD